MCCGGAWRALSVFPRMHASFRFLRYRVIIIIYCSNVFIRHIQLGCISLSVAVSYSLVFRESRPFPEARCDAMQRARNLVSAKNNEAPGEREMTPPSVKFTKSIARASLCAHPRRNSYANFARKEDKL